MTSEKTRSVPAETRGGLEKRRHQRHPRGQRQSRRQSLLGEPRRPDGAAQDGPQAAM